MRREEGGLLPLVLLALLGPALVLLLTRPYGINISPDSAAYLAGAEGLANGEGLDGVDGRPMSLYAPGLSWLLAVPAGRGAAEGAALALNLAGLAAIVLLVGLWLRRIVRPAVALAASALLAISAPLVYVHSWVWSEPLFILLSVGYLVLLVRIARSPDGVRRLAVAAGLVAAAATLVRYSGVSLLPVAGLALLTRPAPIRQRLADAIAFGVAFAVPVLPWLLRNQLRTGEITGERAVNAAPWTAIAEKGLTTLGSWFVPEPVTGPLRTALLLVLAVGGTALAAAVLRRRPLRTDPRSTVLVVAGATVVTVFAVLVALTARTNVDPLGDRLLAPLVVPLVVALATAVDVAIDGLPRRRALAVASAALTAVGSGWLAGTAAQVVTADEDLTSLNSPAWQDPDTLALVDAVPRNGTTISNSPRSVRYLLGAPVEDSPRTHHYASTAVPADDLPRLRSAVREGPVHLVWLGDEDRRGYHYAPHALAEHVAVRKLLETPNGAVYRIGPLPAGEPQR